MNILKKLTLKDLKLNKKRTIGTIIGVILSCALILVVGGFFFVLQDTLVEDEIRREGYYHVSINNLTDKQVEDLKINRDFSNVMVVNKVGVAITDTGVSDEYARGYNIFSYNEKTFKELNYDVIEGHFPKSSNEILIDRAYNYQYNTEVGDTIELNVNGEKKSYTVSGISNRYSEFITTGINSSTYKVFLTLKNPSNYKEDINKLLGLKDYKEEWESPIYGSDYSIRSYLLMYETLSFEETGLDLFVGLFGVAVFVIMVTSIFAIRNSFAISVSEKTKMYGMLSSVGATKKQIKKMVLFEGLVVGLIGIIIGIFFGIFVTWFFTLIINFIAANASLLGDSKLIYNFNILPVIIAILTSLIVIYLSVISGARKASKASPIKNIRNSGDVKSKKIRTPKFISKIFGIGGVISYKNLKRSKKKYRVTIISLTISVFIFIVASSLIDYSLKMVNVEYANLNYNVTLGNADFISKHLDELQKLDNSYTMYGAFGSYKINYSSHFPKEIVVSMGDEEEVIYNYFLYDDESFKKVIYDLNLDYQYMKDKIIVLNKIKNPRNGDGKYINVTDYKKGDVLELVDRTSKDSNQITLDIGAVLVDNYPVGLERIIQSNSNTLNIVGNYKYLNKECFEDHLRSIYYDSEDPYDLVKKINEIDKNIYVENIEESVSQNKSMMLIFSIVAYSFILVLTLIGVTSVFNTINSNMELRKSEFATLKSVGMTKKEFNRMINLESFFYSFKSLFYGLILGLIGSYVVFKMFEYDYSFSYTLPVMSIILAIVFIVVIVLIIMRYSIKKINKYNIIETIRNNNV